MVLGEQDVVTLGMSLPPDMRRPVALRLLDSVEPDASFVLRSEEWLRTQAAAAYDALKPP